MFKIYTDKNKILRTKCKPIKNIAEKDKKLVKSMVEYLKLSQNDEYAEKHHIEPGIGLAAPQIGKPYCFFAFYLHNDDHLYEIGLINPIIDRTSVRQAYLVNGEGCLSVPKGHAGFVVRYNKVVISGFNVMTDKQETFTFYGYPAIAIQHEMDHLNGILYYDHINKQNPYYAPENAIKLM